MKITTLVKNNIIISSAALMLALVVSNAGFIIYNNHVLEKTTRLKAQTQQVKQLNQYIWNDIVRNLDVGVRGYAITQDESLLKPYQEAVDHTDKTFQDLADLL